MWIVHRGTDRWYSQGMEKPRTTPKDFFLWAGAMISLYWAAISFIFLIFNYIDYAFPNALSYLPSNPYDNNIGFEMASIIVFLPIYMLLSWLIRRDIAADHSRKDIWVRRWALILTLFVAGATMAGDLVALLAKFFSGDELTAAFLLKVLTLLLIAAIAFMHFIADYWGYWEQYPSRRRSVCTGVGLMAIVSIVIGFVMFGTPSAARQYRFDEQRVGDLQSIQSQITYYWQRKQSLPANLSDLNDALSNYTVPADPETGAQYTYKRNSPLDFALCATFARESLGTYSNMPMAPGAYGSAGNNWQHSAGETCFDRSIDPQLYPPVKAQ